MILIDQRKQTIIAMAKLAKLTCRCDDACPGWAVFEAGDGLEVESCNDCWEGVADKLTDDEAAALPEAIQLLLDEHKSTGVPLSVWQRSLGYVGIPGLTDAEAQGLQRKLESAWARKGRAS